MDAKLLECLFDDGTNLLGLRDKEKSDIRQANVEILLGKLFDRYHGNGKDSPAHVGQLCLVEHKRKHFNKVLSKAHLVYTYRSHPKCESVIRYFNSVQNARLCADSLMSCLIKYTGLE